MNIHSALSVVTLVTNVVIGLFTFVNDPREKLNRLYALIAASLAVWSVADYFLVNTVWHQVSSLNLYNFALS